MILIIFVHDHVVVVTTKHEDISVEVVVVVGAVVMAVSFYCQ